MEQNLTNHFAKWAKTITLGVPHIPTFNSLQGSKGATQELSWITFILYLWKYLPTKQFGFTPCGSGEEDVLFCHLGALPSSPHEGYRYHLNTLHSLPIYMIPTKFEKKSDQAFCKKNQKYNLSLNCPISQLLNPTVAQGGHWSPLELS